MTGMTSGYRTDGYAKVLPYGMVRCADGLVRVAGHGRVVPEWQLDRSVPVPVPVPEPDRATRVASWIGWHVRELAGVTGPAVVAVAVTPWAWLVSGAVAAGWAVAAVRGAVEQAPLRAAGETQDGPAPDVEPAEAAGSEASGGVA